jgi:hypothetical protein
MKRSGFKPRLFEPPPAAPLRGLTREVNYKGTTGAAQPKQPADRLPALRLLAEGEACTVLRYNGFCRCDPATTVWAHTNALADQKGRGYKGHDTAGFFAGSECHDYIDRRLGAPAEIERLVALAQERTLARLREIAHSKTIRPKKIDAAHRALAMLKAREADCAPPV